MTASIFFDIFATTFLLFLGIGGFNKGVIVELERIISLVFTLWLSITYYVDFAEILQQEFNTNPYFILFVSFSIIFILTLVITRIIIELIDQIVGVRKMKLINRLLGFVIGVVKGTIIIILILSMFELLPIQKMTDTLYKESRIAKITKTIYNKNIEYFGWKDPVVAGKEYVQSTITDNSTHQEDDE
jgi:membrane protein required for colicin V production